jgi:hypothetical protein
MGLVAIALSNDRVVMNLTRDATGANSTGQCHHRHDLQFLHPLGKLLLVCWTVDKRRLLDRADVGMMDVYLPIQTYPTYAASANAMLTPTRSLIAALLSLAD